MLSTSRRQPELLAPAGSLDVFAAAVKAGADAVYIGAPAFNARYLAKHFSAAEVAAMIDYGHSQGVKVYLAMNSLVKEDEIGEVCDLLALCEGLGPDALIIQDLGLLELARSFFPSLELHASTLMAAHNSMAVRHYGQMGFSRVVLAREMTLAEIGTACQQEVDIEVFIHGALCFSYSGLCLFSSYLGGKSGLRGRCVQPCRRRYSWAGKGKGKGKGKNAGYLFSMHDLHGLEVVADLAQLGVASLKIEGRMRSQHYVESVIKAYRLVLDHGDQAMAEAQQFMEQAMGRTATKGYFSGGQPEDALSPQHSGNIGLFLGRLGKINSEWVTVKLQSSVAIGDRLRLHEEKSGERHSLTVKGLRSRGEDLTQGLIGWKVEVHVSGLHCHSGDSLYKVDVKKKAGHPWPLKAGDYGPLVKKIKAKGVGRLVCERLGLKEAKASGRARKRGKTTRGRGNKLPLWLQGDSWQLVGLASGLRPARIVVNLSPASLAQAYRQKKAGRLAKVVVWSLPPVILEDELVEMAEALDGLIRRGFYQFQISHLSQLQFFPAGERVVALPGRRKKDGGLKTRKLVIYGNYTLNILNSQALVACRRLGIAQQSLAIEQDEGNMRSIAGNKGGSQVGFTIYGRPPLFTARLANEQFRWDEILVSPKGERLILQRRGQMTVAMAAEPFSLLNELSSIVDAGIDYGVVDVSGLDLRRRGLEQLFKQLTSPATKGQHKKRLSTFNFRGELG